MAAEMGIPSGALERIFVRLDRDDVARSCAVCREDLQGDDRRRWLEARRRDFHRRVGGLREPGPPLGSQGPPRADIRERAGIQRGGDEHADQHGWRYFTDMAELHGLAPTADHFAAMVDLLGRSGRLFDAKELLESMPFEPDPVAWMTFLTACRIHGKLELGEAAAERVYELDPSSTASYIAMSNIYAAHGMWEKVASVRKKMEERGLKKLPGLSFIEVDGKLHEFSSGGKYHPRTDEICEELTRLHGLMRAAGYVPDTKAVLHDVSEGEKETMLLYHSEKMAIAFGLVSSRGSGEPIRVVKNLRVCSDCHTATKFIARIAGRDIIVRDCNRFHLFSSDGKCSCGDYW
ncbi:hypothetical protein SELMODRAFT_428483 [Selaginella moellendorffii]|uniref:DYW domain-containing protein n=1 Tax=Selaginella moellendorffii TaxID=88036 RepID=D8T302_SELML|nr:hypothetical protein SELMODRAFT_428483 [Selaginella moellendorffii]